MFFNKHLDPKDPVLLLCPNCSTEMRAVRNYTWDELLAPLFKYYCDDCELLFKLTLRDLINLTPKYEQKI